MMCLALPSAAQITSSVHDLNVYVPAIAMPNARVCVACHTPHNANTAVAPLWNHDASAGGHTPYDSGTIDATDLGAPTGISLMCLSCHDGSAALDSFGAGTRTDNTPGTVTLTGTALLDIDLTNDHPVSFTYDTALAGVDPQLHDPSATTSGLGGNIDTDMLFGLGNDQMECSSCHDVHNGPSVVEAPLLIKSNASSGLCFTCHDK
jgi:predicted CXXCH cytochrome family protein